MAGSDLIIAILSCVFFMGLVAWISYLKTRGEVSTRDGYFLAGRGFVDGITPLFWVLSALLIVINGVLWYWFSRQKPPPFMIVGSSDI